MVYDAIDCLTAAFALALGVIVVVLELFAVLEVVATISIRRLIRELLIAVGLSVNILLVSLFNFLLLL